MIKRASIRSGMLKLIQVLMALTLAAIVFSCTSTKKFPLCPKLSRNISIDIPEISKKLADICKKRKIKFTVLSSTTAEFRGPRNQIKWLQDNFFIILCDFNQNSTVNDESVYTTCMDNSKEWIKIVQGENPETLMLDGTNYCAVCCE